MNLVFVAIGGFFGAMARFAVSNVVKSRYQGAFPYGTFFINVLGSLLLGLLVGAHVDNRVFLLCGTGFMGAFTTFSTFKLELTQLRANRKGNVFLSYLTASYVAGIAAAFCGFYIGSM